MSAIPLVVPLCRPLCGPLLRPFSGVDPDARAYVAAVQTAGVVVLSSQRDAISDFIAGEKAAGRWASIKRMYLPIWGVAAANAIDMVTLNVGTYVGTITHSIGSMKPDGSTGYFRSDISPSAAGITTTSGLLFAFCTTPDTRVTSPYIMGCRSGGDAGEVSLYQGTTTSMSCFIGRLPGVEVAGGATASNSGVLIANRRASGMKFSRRAGLVHAYGANQVGVASTITNLPMWFGCLNNAGAAILHSDTGLGVIGFGLGLSSDAETDAFSASVENLWYSVASPLRSLTTTAFATAQRNDFSGNVGHIFTVSAPIYVTALSRWGLVSNTGTHLVQLWDNVSAELARGTAECATLSADGWVDVSCAPTLLAPGTYRITSAEIAASDLWHDSTPSATQSTITLNQSVFAGAGWPNVPAVLNTSFVPVAVRYLS